MIVSLDLHHINYMSIATIIYVLLGEKKNFESLWSLIVGYVSISLHRRGGGGGGRSARG